MRLSAKLRRQNAALIAWLHTHNLARFSTADPVETVLFDIPLDHGVRLWIQRTQRQWWRCTLMNSTATLRTPVLHPSLHRGLEASLQVSDGLVARLLLLELEEFTP